MTIQELAKRANVTTRTIRYYVEQGLGGNADRSGDGRITTRELAAYVRDRVGRWARQVRGLTQTPALHDSEDFDLVLAPRPPVSPAALPKQAPPYPAWLAAAWRVRCCSASSLSAGVPWRTLLLSFLKA